MSFSWQMILEEMRATHVASAELQAFCPFPDDIRAQSVCPFQIPSSALLQKDEGLFSNIYTGFRDAIVEAAPHAAWRQTFKGTNVSTRFLNEFGCYSLIGNGGPFESDIMKAWIVYMPARLYYPWHHHPAEEAYLCLAGQADYRKQGEADKVISAGGVTIHKSNQSHAMETHECPVLNYVVWRNEFDIAPVLTYEDAR